MPPPLRPPYKVQLSDPRFPLGARGERPVFFPVSGPDAPRLVKNAAEIPGVKKTSNGVACTFDAAKAVADFLGLSSYPMPDLHPKVTLPGIEEYKRLGFDKLLRPYQKEMLKFLVPRAYALNSDCMRSGKSLTTIAASTILGLRRNVVVAPSIAKWVWADQVLKWTGDSALILEGRGADEARRICPVCGGSGRRTPETILPELERTDVVNLNKVPHDLYCGRAGHGQDGLLGNPYAVDETMPREEAIKLYKRHFRREMALNPAFRERVESGRGRRLGCFCDPLPCHAKVIQEYLNRPRDPENPNCTFCRALNGSAYGYTLFQGHEAVLDAIQRSRWIIVNPDLIKPQIEKTATGIRSVREELPGWAPTLGQTEIDLVVSDEAHMYLRGRGDYHRPGESTREQVSQAFRSVPRLWVATATPMASYIRDLWGITDAMSDGAIFGKNFFPFDVNFCSGSKGEWGWVNTGRSNEDELRRRHAYWMLKRSHTQLMPYMPKKQRQAIWYDVEKSDKSAREVLTDKGSFAKKLRSLAPILLPYVAEAVCQEMAEGRKVLAVGFLRETMSELSKLISKEISKSPGLKNAMARIWSVSGETDSHARIEMSKEFRRHPGPGVFNCTIRSVPAAVSLGPDTVAKTDGATAIHFYDYATVAADMLQIESRPYEPGITGLSIVYHLLRGTIHERIQSDLLDHLDTLDDIMKEEGASEIKAAMRGLDPNLDLAEAFFEREMARIKKAAAEKKGGEDE